MNDLPVLTGFNLFVPRVRPIVAGHYMGKHQVEQ